MNWDNIRYLLAVVRTGSLRAAVSLNVDQATVARRLRHMEAELNTALFNRYPEGYRLTEHGERLLPDIEQMEATAATIERKSAGMNTSLAGKVYIASTDSLGSCFLLPALSALRQRHPDIQVTLSTSPEIVDIRRGAADLAVRSARPSDGNLIIRRLATFHTGLYASEEYVARRGLPVPGSAFSGHGLVMFPETSVPQYWQRLCGEPLTNGHIVLEVTSQWLFIEALRQGLGVGMMAGEIVQRCCPELVNVMPTRSEPADIWLVASPDVWSAERIQAVITVISSAFEDIGAITG